MGLESWGGRAAAVIHPAPSRHPKQANQDDKEDKQRIGDRHDKWLGELGSRMATLGPRLAMRRTNTRRRENAAICSSARAHNHNKPSDWPGAVLVLLSLPLLKRMRSTSVDARQHGPRSLVMEVEDRPNCFFSSGLQGNRGKLLLRRAAGTLHRLTHAGCFNRCRQQESPDGDATSDRLSKKCCLEDVGDVGLQCFCQISLLPSICEKRRAPFLPEAIRSADHQWARGSR